MKKFFILLALPLLSSCGTVFSGTQQMITVNTNVSGTKVYVNGMPGCSTPCAVELKRGMNNVIIMLKKDGYEEVTSVVASQINPISIINMSSLYSWTTDFLSGGVWRYAPDAIYVEMEKSNMTKAEYGRFIKNKEITRFVLFNFAALKRGGNEQLHSLSVLTGIDGQRLFSLLKSCQNELQAVKAVTAEII